MDRLAWTLLVIAVLLLFFSELTVLSGRPLAVLVVIGLLVAASGICAVVSAALAARRLDEVAVALQDFLRDVRDDTAAAASLRDRAARLQHRLAEVSGVEPKESRT